LIEPRFKTENRFHVRRKKPVIPMPAPTRVLTNSYQDCKLVKMDSHDPNSPFVVMQEGYAPGDPSCRMRLFYLQRGLLGQPLIRELPVSDADIQAYMAKMRGGSSEDLLRQFLARYRAARGQA
jgi:hypothetical protein